MKDRDALLTIILIFVLLLFINHFAPKLIP